MKRAGARQCYRPGMSLPGVCALRLARCLVCAVAALMGSLVVVAGTSAHASSAAVSEEVPFIVSPDNVTLEMLRIAQVGAADHVIDLGSGDGRIVITAAKRFGASGLGVEIDPELVRLSRQSARDAGVADKVRFEVQDLFVTDLSRATVITMYLLPEFNLRLRPSILNLKPGTRIVSHDWDMGDWKPDQTSVLSVPDKKVGLDKQSRVHLWVVPAQVHGVWCGSGRLGAYVLTLQQKYQEVQGTLQRRERSWPITGKLQGATLTTQDTEVGQLQLQHEGARLTLVGGRGPIALARGATFTAAPGAGCSR